MKTQCPFAAMLAEIVDRFGHNDSPEDLECLDRARAMLGQSLNVTLTFIPQAWINDYATEVDAQGPVTWQVPLERLKGVARASYASDDLHSDEAAPEWIREWSGPFEVTWSEDVDALLEVAQSVETHKAKVDELIKAATECHEFIESLLDLTDDAATDHLANNGEGVEQRIVSALFNLQA